MSGRSFPFVVATWGATGRQETTPGSDIDLLCWLPDVVRPDRNELESLILDDLPHRGSYLDLVICDGTTTLEKWAKSNATDFQAVLFAADITGPKELAEAFINEQQLLWADQTMRAKEAWMLVSETILHPRIMDTTGWFRPEKYLVGATRSWVTLGELYALINGWDGRFTTNAALRLVENRLNLSPGTLIRGYARARTLRLSYERDRPSSRLLSDYSELQQLVLVNTGMLIESSLTWLQQHAGVDIRLVATNFQNLFGWLPQHVPPPPKIHASTQRMLAIFTAQSDRDLRNNIDFRNYDWFLHYAVTTNPHAEPSTINEITFPVKDTDSWTHRNVRLWAMRHPAVSTATADAILHHPDSRAMDRAAAELAIQRNRTIDA